MVEFMKLVANISQISSAAEIKSEGIRIKEKLREWERAEIIYHKLKEAGLLIEPSLPGKVGTSGFIVIDVVASGCCCCCCNCCCNAASGSIFETKNVDWSVLI